MNTSQNRKRNVTPLHVLSISAGVTRIRWRPVANVNRLDGDDLHDSMIAVSTAPIKGANAGGAGTLSLWSFHRPYMPLSIVEGHQDGAVVDFDWLETPQQSLIRQGLALASHEVNLFSVEQDSRARIWQHVISVGRDGNCYVQSLVRGTSPLSVNIQAYYFLVQMI
jgi:WD repeat-containing protein 24